MLKNVDKEFEEKSKAYIKQILQLFLEEEPHFIAQLLALTLCQFICVSSKNPKQTLKEFYANALEYHELTKDIIQAKNKRIIKDEIGRKNNE